MAVYGLHWSKYVSSLHTRKMEKYSGIFGKDYSNKNRKCNEAWRHSRDLSTTSSKPRAAIVFNEYIDCRSLIIVLYHSSYGMETRLKGRGWIGG